MLTNIYTLGVGLGGYKIIISKFRLIFNHSSLKPVANFSQHFTPNQLQGGKAVTSLHLLHQDPAIPHLGTTQEKHSHV